ncbi:MAG: YjbH domain-containing protein [bacterium]
MFKYAKTVCIFIAWLMTFPAGTCDVFAGGMLIGPGGALLTPSAELPVDRQMRFGIGKINAPFAFIEGPQTKENYLFYTSLVFLPRFEITLLITSAPGKPGNDGSNVYKDAAVFAQFYLLPEKEYLPAVALGAYDFYSFSFYNALFVVMTKNVKIGLPDPVILNLGYGVDWINKHYGDTAGDRYFPVPHQWVGFFGSVEVPVHKRLSAVFEHDSEKFNSGLRVSLFEHVEILAALLEWKTFSGNLSFIFEI